MSRQTLQRERGGKRARDPRRKYRISRLEWLEPRVVLAAPTLAALADVSLFGGSPLYLPLDGNDADGDALSYTVTSSNPALVATLMPASNPTLRLTISYVGNPADPADDLNGIMEFRLFDHLTPNTVAKITELVNAGFYTNKEFHRVYPGFMMQGGSVTGDGTGEVNRPGFPFDDEFHESLRFTGPGLLAMAKTAADDTASSQFFLMDAASRGLDFNYSIFGALSHNDALRKSLMAVPKGPGNTIDPIDTRPIYDILITKAEIIPNVSQHQVLKLSAPVGASGISLVTITASDGKGGTATDDFWATFTPDTYNDPPFLLPLAPIETSINTPVTFTIPALDVNGDKIYYAAEASPAGAPLTVEILNADTGLVKITPAAGAVGAYAVKIKCSWSTSGLTNDSNSDVQVVPVYVRPGAPVIERLLAGSDTGSSDSDGVTSRDNSTEAKRLTFRLSGLVPNAEVTLYSEGVEIGRGLATGATMDLPTNSSTKLADGTHAITAVQAVGAVASPGSASLSIRVDTAAPVFTSPLETRASVGMELVYDVQTDDEANGGASYAILSGPAGMTLANASTGLIRWTPAESDVGTQTFTVQATDKAGNTSPPQAFTVQVRRAPLLNPLPDQNATEGQLLAFRLAASEGHPPLRFNLVSARQENRPIDPAQAGMVFNPATGDFRWLPGETFGGTTATVVFRVTDDLGASSTMEVRIHVEEVDEPPEFATPSVPLVIPGQTLVVPMRAADPDVLAGSGSAQGNPVRYSLEPGAPEGVAIDASTGTITWNVPAELRSQRVDLTVRATEVLPSGGDGLSSTRTITLEVVDPRVALLDAATAIRPAGSAAPQSGAAEIATRFSGPGVAAPIPTPVAESGVGESGPLGFRLSSVVTLGDNSLLAAGQAATEAKDWDEPLPDRLEPNARPDRQAGREVAPPERSPTDQRDGAVDGDERIAASSLDPEELAEILAAIEREADSVPAQQA